MRRFKSQLFKKKKKEKKIIKFRRRRKTSKKEDLKLWEEEQIALAVREARVRIKKRLIFLEENPISIQVIPQIYAIPNLPTQQDLQKLLSVDHLLNNANELVYWGKYTKSKRPKPSLVNGHRSAEDIIFNPENETLPLDNPREIAFNKKRTELFKRLGFDEPRLVVMDSIEIDKKVLKRQKRKNDKWRVYININSSVPGIKVDNEKKTIKTYTVIQLNGETYETDSEKKALAHAKHNAIIRYHTPGQHIICVRYRVKIKHGKKELIEIGKEISQIY